MSTRPPGERTDLIYAQAEQPGDRSGLLYGVLIRNRIKRILTKEMGPMDTTTSHKEGVAIIALFGRIDTTAAPQLEKEINTLMGEGKRKILLNFSEVTYISSGGLRVLLSTAKKLRNPEDKFGLCCLAQEVNKILKLAGFTTIFAIFSSEGDALAAWK
jgi:anti-anti-sigma factor